MNTWLASLDAWVIQEKSVPELKVGSVLPLTLARGSRDVRIAAKPERGVIPRAWNHYELTGEVISIDKFTVMLDCDTMLKSYRNPKHLFWRSVQSGDWVTIDDALFIDRFLVDTATYTYKIERIWMDTARPMTAGGEPEFTDSRFEEITATKATNGDDPCDTYVIELARLSPEVGL